MKRIKISPTISSFHDCTVLFKDLLCFKIGNEHNSFCLHRDLLCTVETITFIHLYLHVYNLICVTNFTFTNVRILPGFFFILFQGLVIKFSP